MKAWQLRLADTGCMVRHNGKLSMTFTPATSTAGMRSPLLHHTPSNNKQPQVSLKLANRKQSNTCHFLTNKSNIIVKHMQKRQFIDYPLIIILASGCAALREHPS